MHRRTKSKQQEISELLADVFGQGGYDYSEVARRFAEWDSGSPRGVLRWLRQYQNDGLLPRPEARDA